MNNRTAATKPVSAARPKPISPARRVAFDLLRELRQKPHTHSDELLRSKAVNRLSAVDRDLAAALVMGVLRWQIALDERIAAHLTRANMSLPEPVEIALELGALQLLLFDRIPPHAAIFESVELAKQSGNTHAAGLVNAVLRKLVDTRRLGSAPLHFRFPEQIASVWAHPLWMVTRWARAYGLAAATAICQFDQYPPPVIIRLMDPEAEAALIGEGLQLEPGAFVERARRVLQGDVTATQAFARGLVRIQDEGSQLIAELAGRGTAILDCCAAPGGKTAILAKRNPEAEILACDISSGRLKTMRALLAGRQEFARQRGRDLISYRVLDATEMTFDRQFDLVLCDAPCSGTGTLARNPEIRHRIDYEDLRRQQDRQIRLLSKAMNALRSGGYLVYSTCSLEAEENADVVRQALAMNKGFRLLPWTERTQALEGEGVLLPGSAERLLATGSSQDFLQTIPGVHPLDGFFGALIGREAR